MAMRRLCILAALSVILASCGIVLSRPEASPHGPFPLVTFVFDDGNDTDELTAKKIFAEQGAVACSAITTDLINTKNHLTTAQVLALKDAGWEIMSHTRSHPRLSWITSAEVDAELSQSKAVLEGMGLTIKNLVYPYNNNDAMVRNIVPRHYRSARGGASSFNEGTLDPYFLKSFSVKHDLSRIKKLIDRAYADRAWLIFYHHEMDVKVKLTEKQGTFIHGEELRLSPSGTVARYTTVHWFPIYGFHMYLVPFSGTLQTGDVITGTQSGATARIDHVIYDELNQFSEMIRYIRTQYPDMRIVTVDQALDLLEVVNRKK